MLVKEMNFLELGSTLIQGFETKCIFPYKITGFKNKTHCKNIGTDFESIDRSMCSIKKLVFYDPSKNKHNVSGTEILCCLDFSIYRIFNLQDIEVESIGFKNVKYGEPVFSDDVLHAKFEIKKDSVLEDNFEFPKFVYKTIYTDLHFEIENQNKKIVANGIWEIIWIDTLSRIEK